MFRITRRGRGSRGRAPALSVIRSGARLEVREGRYGQGALYAYCDVDDMRARDIYIHTDIPVISERKFFDACSRSGSGSLPDANSLPDADGDSHA